MEDLQEFRRVELISNYIDGVATKDEKIIMEKVLETNEDFLQEFLDAYEFLETLRYMNEHK